VLVPAAASSSSYTRTAEKQPANTAPKTQVKRVASSSERLREQRKRQHGRQKHEAGPTWRPAPEQPRRETTEKARPTHMNIHARFCEKSWKMRLVEKTAVMPIAATAIPNPWTMKLNTLPQGQEGGMQSSEFRVYSSQNNSKPLLTEPTHVVPIAGGAAHNTMDSARRTPKTIVSGNNTDLKRPVAVAARRGEKTRIHVGTPPPP